MLLAVNVGDSLEENRSMRIVQQTMSSFLGHRPKFFDAPFGLHDRSLLHELLRSNGFEQMEISTVSIRTASPSADLRGADTALPAARN